MQIKHTVLFPALFVICGSPFAGYISAPSGWVPFISPTSLEATLSSSAITAFKESENISANGTFTKDEMMLTWVHYECLIYCFGEFTQTNQFALFRK